jgi:hypothetical protein
MERSDSVSRAPGVCQNLGWNARRDSRLRIWGRVPCWVLAFVAAPTSLAAEPPPIELKAGQYVMEDGLGSLSISAVKAGSQFFRISAQGANQSTCGLSGRIEAGEARVLKPLQSECTHFLSSLEVDEIHNDLATALHRSNQDQNCLDELKSTQGGAAGTLAELQKRYVGLPDDLEHYLPVAQITWTLQKFCGGTPGNNQ